VAARGHCHLRLTQLREAEQIGDRQDILSGFVRHYGHSVRWRAGAGRASMNPRIPLRR